MLKFIAKNKIVCYTFWVKLSLDIFKCLFSLLCVLSSAGKHLQVLRLPRTLAKSQVICNSTPRLMSYALIILQLAKALLKIKHYYAFLAQLENIFQMLRRRRTFAKSQVICNSTPRLMSYALIILQLAKALLKIKHYYAFLAQLDRAFVYGTKGQGFESLRTHQFPNLGIFYFV